mmetsp:Transcript_83243/g.220838  ORF Transcript_83243/g.220838 Transcript_83243/m.220838 type:complete len:203 (+) Transcript_83243:159-767(+)
MKGLSFTKCLRRQATAAQAARAATRLAAERSHRSCWGCWGISAAEAGGASGIAPHTLSPPKSQVLPVHMQLVLLTQVTESPWRTFMQWCGQDLQKPTWALHSSVCCGTHLWSLPAQNPSPQRQRWSSEQETPLPCRSCMHRCGQKEQVPTCLLAQGLCSVLQRGSTHSPVEPTTNETARKARIARLAQGAAKRSSGRRLESA